jgi:alkylation response protein AidB-like acyl-CoA dehydrogenase
MDFALSPDQIAMQDSLDRTLERVAPLDRVRQIAAQDTPHAPDVRAALADLGAPAVLVPEAHGGLGLGVLDAALLAETLGRHTACAPFLGPALAAIALEQCGSEAQKAVWLPLIASGEASLGVAISEPASGARMSAGVRAEHGRLSGEALFVIDFAEAAAFIVADTDGGLHLVAADAPGLTRTPLTTIDRTRSLGELVFGDVAAEPLADGDSRATLARMRDVGRVLLAADTLGAAQRMLERAVAYAADRKQFGRVIGSFQAVKHLCAEMAAELEPARALVWYAAYAQDALPDEATLTAAHAKAHLGEVGRFVARTATEVFGGIGITDLLGLHYAFKRIGLDRQLLGAPERARRDAAVAQGLIDA